MEQRKWLSWNDVERLAARLEDVQLERSRRTTYLPGRRPYLGTDTVTRWLLE